jgi:hypothetical protein
VTNIAGATTSSNALLTITPSPPLIVMQPQNQAVVLGSMPQFSVSAIGDTPFFYQWGFNGTNNPIVGATNATLTLNNVQLTNAGVYVVVITNLFGSTLSSNATLTVYSQYYFAWSNILSPRFVNVPLAVAIQAQDAANEIYTNFTGTVILSSTNGLPVNPPVSASFVQGLWIGFVTISQLATNLVLQAGDGLGQPGLANPINIVSPPTLGTVVDGNSLLIFWPVGSPTFVLETSDDLLLTNWVQVSPPPPIPIGGIYLESVPISGTNAFYRLQYSGP